MEFKIVNISKSTKRLAWGGINTILKPGNKCTVSRFPDPVKEKKLTDEFNRLLKSGQLRVEVQVDSSSEITVISKDAPKVKPKQATRPVVEDKKTEEKVETEKKLTKLLNEGSPDDFLPKPRRYDEEINNDLNSREDEAYELNDLLPPKEKSFYDTRDELSTEIFQDVSTDDKAKETHADKMKEAASKATAEALEKVKKSERAKKAAETRARNKAKKEAAKEDK